MFWGTVGPLCNWKALKNTTNAYIHTRAIFFIESFPRTRLRESGCRIGDEPTKNELRSLSAVDIQGHQRGGFCIRRSISSSSSLSLKYALRESGCRIGDEPTKNELRSLSAVGIQGHQRGGFCIHIPIRVQCS